MLEMDATSSSSSSNQASVNSLAVSSCAISSNKNNNGRKPRINRGQNNKRIMVPAYSPPFVSCFINYSAASSSHSVAKPKGTQSKKRKRRGKYYEIQYFHASSSKSIINRNATAMDMDSTSQPYLGIHFEVQKTHEEYVPQFIDDMEPEYSLEPFLLFQQREHHHKTHEKMVPAARPSHQSVCCNHGNVINMKGTNSWCPWSVHYAQQYGCNYYYNAVTGESTWEKPAELF